MDHSTLSGNVARVAQVVQDLAKVAVLQTILVR